MAYIFGSIWDRFNRNALNNLSKSVEQQGKSIQDLVAEGQLTPTQYAQLIQSVNGMVKSGQINKSDLSLNFKTELDANLNTKRDKTVPIGLNDADAEMLAAIEGGTGASFNLLSIPRLQSVTEKHTTFIEISSNLFNIDDVTEGYNLSSSGDDVVSNASYSVSDYFGISPETTYQLYNISRINFYDETKNFISSVPYAVATQHSVTTPTNAQYVRVSVETSRLGTAQINEGLELLPYEPYKTKLKGVKIDFDDVSNVQIKDNQTNFIEKTSNLIDSNSFISGYNIDNETGDLVVNASYGVSDFIEIKGDAVYTSVYFAKIAYYDYRHAYVGVASPKASFTTPNTAKYLRAIVEPKNYRKCQLNKGAELLPYEPYGVKVKNIIVEAKTIKDFNVGVEESISLERHASTNLFNKWNVTPNASINQTTGDPIINEHYSLSEFIPCGDEIDVTISHENRIGYYDKDYKFLSSFYTPSGDDPVTLTTPINTSFIRVAAAKRDIDSFSINLGDRLLPYEPHAIKLSGVKIYDHQEKEFENTFEVEGVLEGTYSAPTLSADSAVGDIRTDQLHSLYDELVANYPDYVTKSEEAQNSLGQPIYRYDFKPAEVDTVSEGEKRPKMILISGIHHEIGNAYLLYQTMKQICEKWDSDESLETLRWNVHFIVVPVVSIYAFDNGGRQNENGVDLARNFAAGWFLADPEVWTYGGPEPLSELEAKYIDRLMRENKEDTVYFGSWHNFYSNDKTNYFLWNAAATDRQVNRGKKLISKMSRKWKKEHEWLPQDDTTFFGFASNTAPQGSEGRHAELTYGIQGSTFEICQQFMLDGEGYFSSNALTLGLEASVNWLILNLKHNI